MEENKYFLLYACCIPVRGANRSVVCDLQKNNFVYISNEVFEMLCRNSTSPFLLESLSKEEREDAELLIQYLINNEMGFIASDIEHFSAIDFDKDDYPDILKNLIIDFDKESKHNLDSISKQLSELRCTAIEMRFFEAISEGQFLKVISVFDFSTIRTINICIARDSWTSYEFLNSLCARNKRIKQVIVHSHDCELVKNIDIQTLIIFTKQVIADETHCGNISPHYFNSNFDFFKESLVTNNCLDSKIGIDKYGYIKNCPSLPSSYGHISETSLRSVLVNRNYVSLSKIKKDEIDVCKDCEFRYICHDCRAFIQDSSNVFSKPQKCNYDPYSNCWL